MQIRSNIKNKIVYGLSLAMLLAPIGIALAKEINLYEQPNTNAKVVAKLDLAAGVVPIYSTDSGDWTKVGDPRNGNTGWIKSSDMQTSNDPVRFTQQVFSDASGPQAYQIFQYGNPKPMDPEQSKKFIKDMEARQQAMQENMQREIAEMNRHFAAMQEFAWPHFWNDEPMMMPVVFVPVKDGAVEQASAKPVVTKPTLSEPAITKS